jgi:hypothetical protein
VGRSRVTKASILVAAFIMMVLTTAGLPAKVASADSSGAVPGTFGQASDPYVTRCRLGNRDSYCMYTSQDAGFAGTIDNPYPMNLTRGFSSPDGLNWTAMNTQLTESQYGWMNGTANHLGAPAMAQGPDGLYYLYVPDLADVNAPHTSSQIGVSWSTGPSGPFTPFTTVHFPLANSLANASDPEVFADGGNRYLLWADGDSDTCGGLSMALMHDPSSILNPVTQITVNGIGTLGGCTPRVGGGPRIGRPFLHGPSLYKFGDSAPELSGLPGPYTLVFSAKPENTPGWCSTSVGQPGTNNEVIAYATSASPTGPYEYQGILMCGSSSELTNQASLVKLTTAAGRSHIGLFYQDGPSGSIHQRKVHAECLFFGGGTFATATRSTDGFIDCMIGLDNNDWALRARQFNGQIVSAQQSNGFMSASRLGVGDWEKFDVLDANSQRVSPVGASQTVLAGSLKAHANSEYVSADNRGTSPLVANRTSVNDWERFDIWIPGDGSVVLTARINGRGVRTQSSRQLQATDPPGVQHEYYDILHL